MKTTFDFNFDLYVGHTRSWEMKRNCRFKKLSSTIYKLVIRKKLVNNQNLN